MVPPPLPSQGPVGKQDMCDSNINMVLKCWVYLHTLKLMKTSSREQISLYTKPKRAWIANKSLHAFRPLRI